MIRLAPLLHWLCGRHPSRTLGSLPRILFLATLPATTALSAQKLNSTWPQPYTVRQDPVAGVLALSTPYYTIEHNLKKGGAITRIQLTHGRAQNLLITPMATHVRTEDGTVFTDILDDKPRVEHRRDGLKEFVTIEAGLVANSSAASNIRVKTEYEYRWGYVKIRREYNVQDASVRVREVCPMSVVLVPSLTDYGYREGITETEGAPPFAFGSNKWGKLRVGNPDDQPLSTRYVPRSMLFADPGVEGLEWFVGSDLSQWDFQLSGRRGRALCLMAPQQNPPGLALSISPFHSTNDAIAMPKSSRFDFYVGVPLLEGRAIAPWFHTTFNRNRGNWVAPDQVRHWAEIGIQTVHCHNDGDYYHDGLFWRDGSYPPYPDMEKYDAVIAECHRAGIRVATYFSNKELHPSTTEFRDHGSEWARKDIKGNVQHNLFRGTNEFGAQMCLRSGWLEFLKFSIDRVLKNHKLDGVYYDWNVALLCHNPLHEHDNKQSVAVGSGHWDMDELLDLMEWTRQRVGPNGLVIVHNTTTPMFVTENFADYVVANEWGYGKWKDNGPELNDLPLEWSLVGARSRGVISYGQIDPGAPGHLHKIFALEAMVAGVTPWPASQETFELYPVLKPIGDFSTCRFLDWRNSVVSLGHPRCASAIYSRPGEAFVLIANLTMAAHQVHCRLRMDRLPYPLDSAKSAVVLEGSPRSAGSSTSKTSVSLDVRQLAGDGAAIQIPATNAVLVHIR